MNGLLAEITLKQQSEWNIVQALNITQKTLDHILDQFKFFDSKLNTFLDVMSD